MGWPQLAIGLRSIDQRRLGMSSITASSAMVSPRRVQPWTPSRQRSDLNSQPPSKTTGGRASGSWWDGGDRTLSSRGGRDIEGSRPALTRFPRRSQAIAADPYPWRRSAPRSQGHLAGADAGTHPYGLQPHDADRAVVRSDRGFRNGEYSTTHRVMAVDGLKSPPRPRTSVVPDAQATPGRERRSLSPARPRAVESFIHGSSPRSAYQRLQDRITRAKSPARPVQPVASASYPAAGWW